MGQIAEEVVSHLTGLIGAKVEVTLEIEAEIPDGAPEHVVRARFGLYRAGNVRCPICLTPFMEDEVRAGETVSLEHVPAKAVGGSVMCLTCTRCNAHAGGGTADQALAMMDRETSGGGVKESPPLGWLSAAVLDGVLQTTNGDKIMSSPPC